MSGMWQVGGETYVASDEDNGIIGVGHDGPNDWDLWAAIMSGAFFISGRVAKDLAPASGDRETVLRRR